MNHPSALRMMSQETIWPGVRASPRASMVPMPESRSLPFRQFGLPVSHSYWHGGRHESAHRLGSMAEQAQFYKLAIPLRLRSTTT
jgi:hypothetical protein